MAARGGRTDGSRIEHLLDGDNRMTSVTVSSRYRIVIPKAIRTSLGIKPGMRVHAIQDGGHLVLVPARPRGEARGFLYGIDTTVPREKDRT